MTVKGIVPLQQGTRFIIDDKIPTSWAGIYPAIQKTLKDNLPSVVSVHILPTADEESGNDLIEVIHDFQELSAEAIRHVLEEMIFDQDNKCVLMYKGQVVTPD